MVERKMHLLVAGGGMYAGRTVVACFWDADQARLRTTRDERLVTCKTCLRLGKE